MSKPESVTVRVNPRLADAWSPNPSKSSARAISMSVRRDRSTKGIVVVTLAHPVWSRYRRTRATDLTPFVGKEHDGR